MKAFCLLLLLALTLGCSEKPSAQKSPTTESASYETLLETKCTQCHTSDRWENKNYTSNEWENVVNKMIKYGAQLNDIELKTILSRGKSK